MPRIDPTLGGIAGSGSLATAISDLLPIIVAIAGVILVIVLIVGGIMYITAGGDPEASGKAKKIILDAIIGMVIVAVAYLIAKYVTTTLIGGTGPGLQ